MGERGSLRCVCDRMGSREPTRQKKAHMPKATSAFGMWFAFRMGQLYLHSWTTSRCLPWGCVVELACVVRPEQKLLGVCLVCTVQQKSRACFIKVGRPIRIDLVLKWSWGSSSRLELTPFRPLWWLVEVQTNHLLLAIHRRVAVRPSVCGKLLS